MASIISRVLAKFGSRSSKIRPNRRSQRRLLGFEAMEHRRLLAGDLGAIAGNVFTDQTDDGFGVGTDTAIVAATLTLYRDGGDTLFDGGAGDDTQVGTPATTDASGNYRFDGLTPGRYFVQQAAVTGQLQRASESVKTVDISAAESTGTNTLDIDTFDATATSPDPLTALPGTTATDQVTTASGEALGGQRDVVINNNAGSFNSIQVSAGTGVLFINNGGLTTGNAILSYDGVDANANVINHSTLGPVNLMANDGEAFYFLGGSEAGNTLTVDVFSSSTAFSSHTVAMPVVAGAAPTDDLIIRFSDFTIGGGATAAANFASVTAINIRVDLASASDAALDFVSVVAPFVSTQNFANLDPMTIGDSVFNDANNNGVQDAGESGISGVTVELYQDDGATAGTFDGTDTLVSTTTTDGSGNYSFGSLFPGEYIALVPISQFAGGGPLFGFLSSDAGAFEPAPDPDATDTNGDDSGTLIAGVGVASAAITLASGTEPTNDGDTDADTNLAIDFGFVPQIDLEVAKSTGGVTTVTAGNQLEYTITVTNNGPATATNVLVVDDLPNLSPDAMTIISATSVSGNGTVTQTGNANGEVEITYPSLASGASETISIIVGIPATATAAAAITNTVTVSGDGNDTVPANNQATADVAIDRQAVLEITKSDNPDPAVVGSSLSYTIIVTNNGPSTATNLVVSDALPAGLTFVSATESTGTGTAGGAAGVVTATIPTLAVNAAVTVAVVTTIDSTFTGTTLANTATAEADEAATVTATENTTVNPSVDLAITKSDNVDPVNRGSQLTYTLDVVNNGPSPATNVVVVDTLPAGVSFSSASGGTVTPPAAGSSNVSIAVGNLASGGTAQVTIVVDVLQSAAASFTNTAVVSSDETNLGFDPNTANNSAAETTATQGSVDLAITKTDSADPIMPGTSFLYTIVATNNGPSDATQVSVSDNLPDGIQITDVTTTVGTRTIPSSAQDTIAANNDDLVINVGNLAAGASATITVTAIVLPETRGTLNNVATVSTADASLIETDATNNSDTETTTMNPTVDLIVTKTDSIDPVIAGNALTYSMVVTNNGPSTATGITLSDTLPAGVTFTSASSTQGGTPVFSGGVVTATIGTLAPSASATVTIIVGVNSDTRGTIANTATVAAAETESNAANNSASASTTVNANVDLAITKVDSLDPVAAGGTLTYTIVVTNNGPSTATGVTVNDTLPSSLTFASGSSSVGAVNNSGNAVTANVGTLTPGGSATITINAGVAATATGTISNTATVSATETDTVSSNNSATQPTEIAVPGSIAGTVFMDRNKDTLQDPSDDGIAGVLITLTGTDILGNSVNRTETTDTVGNYLFSSVLPGTYVLTETQPTRFGNGSSLVGQGATGTAGTNQITAIDMTSGAVATDFDFTEFLSVFSKRRFLSTSEPGD